MGAPAITFLVSALGYAAMLCGSPYWLDSGELTAASFELGLAHAPGQPLAMLLGKLFCFLPLGDLSLRVGLAQLFCGAGAAAVLAAIGRRVARRFCDDASVAEALGVAAGVSWAASYAAGFQAIRPEVYALSALLVLGALLCCMRYTDSEEPRWLGLAGLLFGLGLSNHHYLTVLGAVPPALAILWRRPDAALRRGIGLGALGTLAGLVPYAYLPLRAAHDPIVEWGHPSTIAAFLWTVTARSFHKSAGALHGGDLLALVGALADQLTVVAPLLALGGLYLCARKAPRMALWLFGGLAGPILARLLVPFDAGNPDAYGYLSTGIAALALSCLPLLAALLSAMPAAARRWAAIGVAAGAFALGAVRAPAYSLARFEETRATFAPLLEAAPSDAIVVPAYYQTTFSLGYLRVVEGTRPDLSYLPRHFLDQPGVPAALLRQDARLAPLVRDGQLDVAALLADPRPRLVEYDVDLDARLIGGSLLVPTPPRLRDHQSRRYALWQAYLAIHRMCRLGAAPGEIGRAAQGLERMAGERSEALVELLDACPGLRGQ